MKEIVFESSDKTLVVGYGDGHIHHHPLRSPLINSPEIRPNNIIDAIQTSLEYKNLTKDEKIKVIKDKFNLSHGKGKRKKKKK